MANRIVRPAVNIQRFVREIEVRRTSVATFHRALQLVVLSYIFLYIVWRRKGYQRFQEPRGSSVIKIKGIGRVSVGNPSFLINNTTQTLWDASEFAIPPIEENAFFIATRKTITYSQTLSICPSALTEKLFCNETKNTCKQGKPTDNSLGILTGRCLSSLEDKTKQVCEIKAWCPEELSDSTDDEIDVNDLRNFTVFIKTIVSFSEFQIKLRTVKDDTKFTCRFHSDLTPHCPIFRIGYILDKLLEEEEDSKPNLAALYYQGGLVEIKQDWKCNFDFEKDRRGCFPTYSFKLLQSGDDRLSPGINYRYADKYRANEIEYRTLTKMYGIRFVLTITGEGGKFDFYFLFLAVGSGISCMVIADFVFNVSTTSIQWTSTSTTTAPPKCPKLITFDNIQNAVRTPQPMPLGFSGFQWVNANYMNVTYHEQINGLSGYSAALSSGHFIAVNKDGQNLNVIINAAESFSLKSMVVASAWNDNLILEITGKRGGAVLNSKKLTLDMKPQQIDLNWSHLEVVTFSAYNGASNSTEKGKETSFGFDNLCIEFTK
ncbi:hypothetical protein I4U23_023377 [Adineta vaga]|nr:hypothetical protein I4U23_023377 [Adineta vaga]